MKTRMVTVLVPMLMLSVSSCLCDTHYVSTSGSNQYPYTTPESAALKIQEAVDAAEPGDTVRVAQGEYKEEVKIKPSLKLVGDGWDSTSIVPSNPQSDIVVSMSESSTLSGFTIAGGGRAVCQTAPNAKSWEIRACRVINAKWAGIVMQGEGAVVACILCANGWGVCLTEEARATLRETTFLKNSEYAIDFLGWGTLSLEHCTISGNGGAFGFSNGMTREVTVTDSILCGNVDDSLDKLTPWWGRGTVNARHSVVNDPTLDGVDGNRYVDPGFVGYGAFNDSDNPIHVDANFFADGDGSADRPFSRISSALALYDYELGLQSPCMATASDGTNIGALPDFVPSRASGSPTVLIKAAKGSYPEYDLRLMHREHVKGEGAATCLEPPPSWHCSLFDTTCFRLGNGAIVEGVAVIGACAAFELDHSSPTIRDCLIYDCGCGFFCYGSRGDISRCHMRNSGIVWADSADTVTNCTIVESLYEGLSAWGPCEAHISDSILWYNRKDFLNVEASNIDHCNSEDPMFAGQNGNISADPLFVGWGGCVREEPMLFIDAAAPEGGDGTRPRPFKSISEALASVPPYDYRLSASSPCLTAGSSGAAIGAFPDQAPTESPVRHLVLSLAPGEYAESSEITLQVETSLVGAGKDASIVRLAAIRPGLYGTVEDLGVCQAAAGIVCPPNWRGEIGRCRIAFCEDGGVEMDGGATITDSEIVNCGWGVAGEGDIINCLVANNLSDGIHVGYLTTGLVERCTITGNGGDGISCMDSQATIRGCRISGNKGSGIGTLEATVTVEDCIIYGNDCGIDFSDSNPSLISNCLVFGHIGAPRRTDQDQRCGTGIRGSWAGHRIINCTVSYNSCGISAGGELVNCIVQGNYDFNITPTGHGLSVTCSNVGGWSVGSGNIDADPRFVNPGNGDFRLLPDSPCIDAGIVAESMPPQDLAGMHRVMFGGKELRPDMGAFEYYINELASVANGQAMILTWNSLSDKTYSVLYSEDAVRWFTAETGIVSWGNTTTCWINSPFSGPQPPPGQVRRRYYRIVEEQ